MTSVDNNHLPSLAALREWIFRVRTILAHAVITILLITAASSFLPTPQLLLSTLSGASYAALTLAAIFLAVCAFGRPHRPFTEKETRNERGQEWAAERGGVASGRARAGSRRRVVSSQRVLWQRRSVFGGDAAEFLGRGSEFA